LEFSSVFDSEEELFFSADFGCQGRERDGSEREGQNGKGRRYDTTLLALKTTPEAPSPSFTRDLYFSMNRKTERARETGKI
jgi:hypothetical protein